MAGTLAPNPGIDLLPVKPALSADFGRGDLGLLSHHVRRARTLSQLLMSATVADLTLVGYGGLFVCSCSV